MKRSVFNRELDDGELDVEQLAMANCAMLLSRVDDRSGRLLNGRIFKCKTCSREFDSFQALGGHRASHKRPPKQTEKNINNDNDKKHVCSVCMQEFGTGQALGGHMRRHRGVRSITDDDVAGTMTEGNSVISSAEEEVVPGVKKEASSSIGNNNTTIRLFGVFMNVTSPNNENDKGCSVSTCDTVAGEGGMSLGLGR